MNLLKRLKNDSKLLLIILLLIAIVLMIIFMVTIGFTFTFWILILLWIVFFYTFLKHPTKYSFKLWIIYFCIAMIFSVVGITTSASKNKGNKSTSNTAVKQLSADECKPFVDKYNQKVLKMKGDNAIGSIGISINPNDCKYTARYIITLNASLAENPIQDIAVSNYYTYENNLHKASETSRGHFGVGVLSTAYQNAMTLPSPYSTSTEVASFYRPQNMQSVQKSNSFYWSYERAGNFTESRYQEFLDDNVFEIVDGLPFIVKEPSTSGGFTYSVDSERAEKEGTIVKTINFTISE